jgi:autotransporter adhesin
MALGSGSVASGERSVAIGTNAVAENGAAVSIGAGNRASGAGAVAIGDPNVATGRGAVAIGADNFASGDGAVALGADSVANGRSAIALGRGANARAAASVAIGEGAVASRAGQVSLGSAASTYTLAGIGSAESRAAQSGDLRYLTSDAAGNLALSDIGPGAIGQLDWQIRRDRDDARRGIATAVAIGTAPIPSEPGRTSYVLNGATYRGEQAIGGGVAHRLNLDDPVAVTAGFSYGGGHHTAVKVGVAGEF